MKYVAKQRASITLNSHSDWDEVNIPEGSICIQTTVPILREGHFVMAVAWLEPVPDAKP